MVEIFIVFINFSYRFQETLNMCHMFEEPVKVIASRIVSMDFHPSESKLLLLAGDKYGNIGELQKTKSRICG